MPTAEQEDLAAVAVWPSLDFSVLQDEGRYLIAARGRRPAGGPGLTGTTRCPLKPAQIVYADPCAGSLPPRSTDFQSARSTMPNSAAFLLRQFQRKCTASYQGWGLGC
jgi:hypothetical protein